MAAVLSVDVDVVTVSQLQVVVDVVLTLDNNNESSNQFPIQHRVDRRPLLGLVRYSNCSLQLRKWMIRRREAHNGRFEFSPSFSIMGNLLLVKCQLHVGHNCRVQEIANTGWPITMDKVSLSFVLEMIHRIYKEKKWS